MMLLDRARCPVKDNPDVSVEPCCGVWSVETPGVMIEKLMKFRPLIGTVDLLLAGRATTARTVRLHKRFLARDRDRSLAGAMVSEVERDRLAEKQVDVLTLLRGEAVSRGGDDVFARRKGWHRVASALLGFRHSHNVRLHIRDGDRRLDQHPSD